MVGPEKHFQNGGFQMAGKRYFDIGFCKYSNKIFHKRAMLQIFYAECTESMSDILSYSESTIGPPWLGQETNFQNQSYQQPEKRYFMTGFCKFSKCFP